MRVTPAAKYALHQTTRGARRRAGGGRAGARAARLERLRTDRAKSEEPFMSFSDCLFAAAPARSASRAALDTLETRMAARLAFLHASEFRAL